MTHPIPIEALDGKLGVLGITGSGKTFTAIGLVEMLLDAGRQVIAIDPTGAYHGLRSAFPIPIFGGRFGDVPIGEEDGEAVARAILDRELSCIVDVSALLKESHAAARRFMAPFIATLKNSPPAPRYLAIDEADEFMPEHASGNVARLFGDLKWIVRRGRIEGWRVLMVTQRPQDIAKSVLTQCETLVIHQLTAPQDRKAVEEWVKGNADAAEAREVLKSLASLGTGEAWIWSPRHNLLTRAKLPANRSIDSSKTPEIGDGDRPRTWQPVDAAGLIALLAKPAAIAEAESPDYTAARVAQLDEANRKKDAAVKRLADGAMALDLALGIVNAVVTDATKLKEKLEQLRDGLVGTAQAEPEPAPPPPPPAPKPKSTGDAPAKVDIGGGGKTLAILAGVYPRGMSRDLLAIRAGINSRGSTMSSYLSVLRQAGMITAEGGEIFATANGAAYAGAHLEVDLPPEPGPDLVRWWAQKVGAPSHVVDLLISRFPHMIARGEIAETLSINPRGSTLSSYLSKLRTARMIEENGQDVRLSALMMK